MSVCTSKAKELHISTTPICSIVDFDEKWFKYYLFFADFRALCVCI